MASTYELTVVKVNEFESWDCEKCGVEPTVAYVCTPGEYGDGVTTGYCERCLGPALLALLKDANCWACGTPMDVAAINGGNDDNGDPITTCSECGERQERE